MKKILSLVLVVILTLSMSACTEEFKDGVTSEIGVNIADGKVFGLNETAVTENLKITAIAVEETNGIEYFEAAEGNVYVGVKFEIENISDENQNISALLTFAASENDVMCEYSISGIMAFEGGGKTLDGTIAPGKKLIGYYAVEVAEDWEELEIQVQPDILDETKVTFVLSK